MSFQVRIPTQHFEDTPQLIAANLIARGRAGIGCNLVAEMDLIIYSDKAKVTTRISDYESLPPEMQKTKGMIDSYFANVSGVQKGDPLSVSFPGRILHAQQLSEQEYDALVSVVNESVEFPSVRSWSWHWFSEDPNDSEVQKILINVEQVVTKFFPNQEKKKMEVKYLQREEDLDIAFEPLPIYTEND